MNTPSNVPLPDGHFWDERFVPQEISTYGAAKVYYSMPFSATGDTIQKRRYDVLIATGVLVASVVVMAFDFALGSVLGMPAFAYLLASAKER